MPDMVPVQVVRTGGTDYLAVPTQRERIWASLLGERAAYEKAGDAAGVAAVDAELIYHGYTEEKE
jgi:ActR/RegA family two-component response regulator